VEIISQKIMCKTPRDGRIPLRADEMVAFECLSAAGRNRSLAAVRGRSQKLQQWCRAELFVFFVEQFEFIQP
jgi:hypothetical protein